MTSITTRNIVFSGGVANNAFIVEALEEKMRLPVVVPPTPSIVGALGAAVHGAKEV